MPVYAGYQGNQINRPSFSEIALKGAQQLVETEKERETLRNELAQENQDAFIEMQNSAAMQGAGKEGFFQQAADTTRDNLYGLYKQLTSNQITPQEYRLKKQMMMNGWGQVDQVFKTFEDKTKAYQDKVAAGTNTAIDDKEFELLSDLSKLSNKQIYIDPKTKAMMIANIGEDGKVVGYVPVSSAAKLTTTSIPKYDYNTGATKMVSQLPMFEGVVDGKLVMSPRYADGYEANVNSAADQLLQRENQRISIATDSFGWPVVDANTYNGLSDAEKSRAVYFTVDADGNRKYTMSDSAIAALKQEIVADIKERTPYKEDPNYALKLESLQEGKRHNVAMEGAAYAAARNKTKTSGGKPQPVLQSRYKYLTDLASNTKDANLRGRLIGKETNLGVIESTGYNKNGDLILTFITEVDGTPVKTTKSFTSKTSRMQIANDALNDGLGQNDWVSWEDLDVFAGGYFDPNADYSSDFDPQTSLDQLAFNLNNEQSVESKSRTTARPSEFSRGISLGNINF